jgi:alpha-1,3-rhamnosyltransferase
VLETLESAKAQTYQNIELIITDDCSKDHTVELCRNWLKENEERFVRTELITSEKNTGISPNVNRGYNAARGEWIKSIAGDDLLIDSSIEVYINFCNQTPECNIVFGKLLKLQNGNLTEMPIPQLFKLDINEQKKLVFLGSGIQAPGLFLKKSFYVKLGGFDEQYKFIEDLPFWIKVSRNNELFYFINEHVVKYRVHDNNICLPGSSRYISRIFFKDNCRIIIKEILPYLISNFHLISIFNSLNYIIVTQLIILFGNKNNKLSRFLNLFIIKTTITKYSHLLKKKIV